MTARAWAASVEEVFREAAARWTLIAYFALSSLFILIFALAVNLDIVNGALAGAKLFGQSVDVGRGAVDLDRLVLGFESGFSGFLYLVGTFLALFATAHLVPRLQEKGTIDLYLSRPVGRVSFLLSRFAGGLLLAGANLVYLIGSIWAILIWKTHVVHARFLLAGGTILFTIAALLAFAFLIGVVTSSTGVSLMTTYGVLLLRDPRRAREDRRGGVGGMVGAPGSRALLGPAEDGGAGTRDGRDRRRRPRLATSCRDEFVSRLRLHPPLRAGRASPGVLALFEKGLLR